MTPREALNDLMARVPSGASEHVEPARETLAALVERHETGTVTPAAPAERKTRKAPKRPRHRG